MKFAVTGAKDTKKIIELVKSKGLEIDMKRPDFVVTYGGDGSILYAEREHPGIPKITVLASSAGKKCIYKEAELAGVLEKIKSGDYKIREEMKLEAECKGKKYAALNEIQLHNKTHVKAVRFSVYVNGSPAFEKIIGDGAVISTPFGSTAYYSSAGGNPFAEGIGIILNNPHDFKGRREIIADEASEIRLKLIRDEGIFLFDNSDIVVNLKEGDEILVRKSREAAKFVVVK